LLLYLMGRNRRRIRAAKTNKFVISNCPIYHTRTDLEVPILPIMTGDQDPPFGQCGSPMQSSLQNAAISASRFCGVKKWQGSRMADSVRNSIKYVKIMS
jgi:hypothetical protein